VEQIVNTVFGAVAGATLSTLVTIYREKRKEKKAGLTGEAHKLVSMLPGIEKLNGHYYVARSADDNFAITNHVYTNATGRVIATCFRENPADYEPRDLARMLKKDGVAFTRITREEVCNSHDRDKALNAIKTLHPNSRLICIPAGKDVNIIDGIFVKCPDKTNIAFITFPATSDKNSIRGVLLYGHIAKAFYDYFAELEQELVNIPTPTS
jgi:hypothetical protein